MADWYVDFTVGVDATGTGASGAPYKTINKATTVAADADTVYVSPDTYTSGFIDTAKNLHFRIWPGRAGHVVISGNTNGNLNRLQSTCAGIDMRGNSYSSEFQFINANTTDGTVPRALFMDGCPSTAVDSYYYEYVRFTNTPRIGLRFEKPNGLTMRNVTFTHCGNGLSLYALAIGEALLHGDNINLTNIAFIDMDSMVRLSGTGAASDYGGTGLALEGVYGKIRIKNLVTIRCAAERPGATELVDGSGVEVFGAGGDVQIDGWLSIDCKNIWEGGTQDVDKGSAAVTHPDDTTLNGSIIAGATSMVVTAVGPKWLEGGCLYIDTVGTKEIVTIDSISGTTVTFHLAGSTATGLASGHTTGCRIALAMPNTPYITNGTFVASDTRPTVGATSLDGYVRGGLSQAWQGIVDHCTFVGFDQFAVSIPDQVGDTFAGSARGQTYRDCIFYSRGGTDANAQTRRCVQLTTVDHDALPFDRNTYYNETGGGVLFRYHGSDKTTWANVQATGQEPTGNNVDPTFGAARSGYLGSSSTLIDIGLTPPAWQTTRQKHGKRWDRGGTEFMYLQDFFWRTQVDSIGTSDSGLAWDVDGTLANFDCAADGWLTINSATNVTNRAGVVVSVISGEYLSMKRWSALPDATKACRLYDTFHIQNAGSGDMSNNCIRAEYGLDPAGALFLTTASLDNGGAATTLTGGGSTAQSGLTIAAGDKIWTKTRWIGDGTTTYVWMKAWKDGVAEPAAWTIIGANTTLNPLAGGVGVRAFSNATATVTMSFGAIQVRTIPEVFTTFNRQQLLKVA